MDMDLDVGGFSDAISITPTFRICGEEPNLYTEDVVPLLHRVGRCFLHRSYFGEHRIDVTPATEEAQCVLFPERFDEFSTECEFVASFDR